jgi:energy-coupling factor transporter ATP-binding protein EcfA2
METKVVEIKLFENASPPNSTIFVLGSTGSGKSTLMANLLLERDRFLIFDTREEFDIAFFEQPGKAPAVIVTSLNELVAALNAGKKRIILRVDNTAFTDELVNQACYLLIDFLRVNPGLNITLAMDEVNAFVTSTTSPPGLRELIQRGRAYGVQKIFGAQWFNAIPPYMRDSFSEIYVYRHADVRGLANLTFFGFNPEDVKTLPNYTVLHLENGQIERIRLDGKE